MPSTYAHYYFGQRVLHTLDTPTKKLIKQYRHLFDLGLHGPDFFFYYHPLFKNDLSRKGHELHSLPGAVFFNHAFQLEKRNQPDHLAYLYGVMCHFTLDAFTHPYIEDYCRKHHISHGDLEGEFERYLLNKNHFNPASYALASLIQPSKEIAYCMADFYEGVNAKQIYQCLTMMHFLHQVTHCPHPLKHYLLDSGMKLVGASSLKGHIIVNTPLEGCVEANLKLDELFEDAIGYANKLIMKNNFKTDDPLYSHTFGED